MNMTKPSQEVIVDIDQLELPQYIDRPDFIQNKKTEYTLRVIGWCIFMVLMMPLITLFVWFYDIHNIYSYVFFDSSQVAHFNLINLGLLILILACVLLSWASYNWFRFRRGERRNPTKSTSLKNFSRHFQRTEQEVLTLRTTKNITFYYDDEGSIIDIVYVSQHSSNENRSATN